MTKTIDIDDLEVIVRDLEAAHYFLDLAYHREPGRDASFEEWNAHGNRAGYIIDRLGEHVAALRKLVDQADHGDAEPPAG